MNKGKRKTQSARRYALLVVTVLASCSRSPLRTAHDGAAAGGGGGENWDVPGATGASAQGGGSVAIGGAGGTGTGGTLGSSARDAAPGGAVDASSTHGAVDATGIAISMDGSPGAVQDGATSESEIDASPDGWCDEMPLWNAITEGAGFWDTVCLSCRITTILVAAGSETGAMSSSTATAGSSIIRACLAHRNKHGWTACPLRAGHVLQARPCNICVSRFQMNAN